MFLVRSLVALAVLATPVLAHAESPQKDGKSETKPDRGKPARTARVQKAEPRTCAKPTVEISSGSESSTFSLATCKGVAAPLAVERLSVLARPASAAKPKATFEALARTKGPEVAPGIKRVDPRLVERLELAVEHFRKADDDSVKVQVVSGIRPKSAGSYHQSGRALDFRIEGVTNEALVAFCKTLPDTGCGYYPNSLFVHMDVRDKGAGHVAWIDVSKPGESPKYVSAWPLLKDAASKDDGSKAAGVKPETSDKPGKPEADDERSLVLPALPSPDEGKKAKHRKSFFF